MTENYAPNARANSKNTFSTFNAALGASGLASVFSRNDLTAFAPTDAAFAELGLNPGNIRRLPNLTEILLYHVVGGTVLSTDLSNTFAQTLNGQFIEINADKVSAFEFKWPITKKAKLPKSFSDAYNPSFLVVNKDNFREFLK